MKILKSEGLFFISGIIVYIELVSILTSVDTIVRVWSAGILICKTSVGNGMNPGFPALITFNAVWG